MAEWLRRAAIDPAAPRPIFPQVLPTFPFHALQELNLDHNLLVNFAALGGLRSLGVLRLSYNRIESVSPR